MGNLSALPTIISGILAVISYGFFSKHYEPLVRKSPNSLYSAALLYGWAGIMLFLTSATIAVFFGPHFDLPGAVTVFGFHVARNPLLLIVFFSMILCMSLLYYKSKVSSKKPNAENP